MIGEIVVATNLVIACVLGEAYPHTKQAYLEIAAVLRNRTDAEWLGAETAEDVATAPKQFSAMNNPKDRTRLLNMKYTHPELWALAEEAINETFDDDHFYRNELYLVNHYVTERLYNSDRRGWWQDMKVRKVSNGHVFLEG